MKELSFLLSFFLEFLFVFLELSPGALVGDTAIVEEGSKRTACMDRIHAWTAVGAGAAKTARQAVLAPRKHSQYDTYSYVDFASSCDF